MRAGWAVATPCPGCPPLKKKTYRLLSLFLMNHEGWVGGGHPLPCLLPFFFVTMRAGWVVAIPCPACLLPFFYQKKKQHTANSPFPFFLGHESRVGGGGHSLPRLPFFLLIISQLLFLLLPFLVLPGPLFFKKKQKRRKKDLGLYTPFFPFIFFAPSRLLPFFL